MSPTLGRLRQECHRFSEPVSKYKEERAGHGASSVPSPVLQEKGSKAGRGSASLGVSAVFPVAVRPAAVAGQERRPGARRRRVQRTFPGQGPHGGGRLPSGPLSGDPCTPREAPASQALLSLYPALQDWQAEEGTWEKQARGGGVLHVCDPSTQSQREGKGLGAAQGEGPSSIPVLQKTKGKAKARQRPGGLRTVTKAWQAGSRAAGEGRPGCSRGEAGTASA